MSSDGTNGSTPNAGNTSSERLTGRVKWFNNRAGFGFVTVLDGDKKDEDVFVHHSGIEVSSEQYKYLVQGEYVSFSLRESDNDEHPYQAGDVRGVLGGWLMCETRNANRSSRDEAGDDDEEDTPRRRPRRQTSRRVRPRGSGPRSSGGDSDEWVLTRRSRPQRSSRNA